MDGRLTPHIRRARTDDDAALLAIDVGEPGGSFPSVVARERISFFASSEEASTLVAEVDGVVVGYLTLCHPTQLPENAHVFSIVGFAVRPELRRRGVGQALLDAAKAAATRSGGAKLSLRVLASNERARQAYAAAGFSVEGVLAGEFVIDGTPVDDVLMATTLP